MISSAARLPSPAATNYAWPTNSTSQVEGPTCRCISRLSRRSLSSQNWVMPPLMLPAVYGLYIKCIFVSTILQNYMDPAHLISCHNAMFDSKVVSFLSMRAVIIVRKLLCFVSSMVLHSMEGICANGSRT